MFKRKAILKITLQIVLLTLVSSCTKTKIKNKCGEAQPFFKNFDTSYIGVPNAFSPNGDGLDEYFKIYSEGLTEFEMEIFDKWGRNLFKTNDSNQFWDGRHKGKFKYGIFKYTIKGKNSNNERIDIEGELCSVGLESITCLENSTTLVFPHNWIDEIQGFFLGPHSTDSYQIRLQCE